MKIIAVLDRDRFRDPDHFLVEVTRGELAKIVGKGYASDVSNLGIGDQVDVSKIYKQLSALQINSGTLEQQAQALEAFARLLRTTDPIIKALLEPPAENEGAPTP